MRTVLKSKGLVLAMAASAVALSTAPACASVVVTGTDYSTSPVTFSFGDSTFTFSSTGDWFNPTAVQTAGTGKVNDFFGTPTTNFVDRGTVVFGPDFGSYSAFSAPTTIPFSNGDNFIGLEATLGSDIFFGYAFTTNTFLNSVVFSDVPGQAITASVDIPAAVPEPATWAMMLLGFGAIGMTLRFRRRALAPA